MTDLAAVPLPGVPHARPDTQPLPRDWTIGTGRLGPANPPRHDAPQHRLTLTLTFDGGHVDRWVHADHYTTAAEAQRSMERRMCEVGWRVKSGPGWMERRYEVGERDLWRTERLEWADVEPEARP